MFVEVKLQPACQLVRGGWGSVAGVGGFWTPARGKFTDEMWHRPTECNFKLPHLQERWNQVPNFTMMMSVRIHDSTGLGCQVPLHMFPPPLFFFFQLIYLFQLKVVSWEVLQHAVFSSHERWCCTKDWLLLLNTFVSRGETFNFHSQLM